MASLWWKSLLPRHSTKQFPARAVEASRPNRLKSSFVSFTAAAHSSNNTPRTSSRCREISGKAGARRAEVKASLRHLLGTSSISPFYLYRSTRLPRTTVETTRRETAPEENRVNKCSV
ncbi:Hypothetical protein NTJ_09169 [Nesidiocoris tenuis]|uniref:Uncharacterized protein n=1 Tax=Nesidiocoris tenuis TaxID=355587 RepID=A0ABN7AW07_9HEMI|nr:Hypothetical protein NTJ_09169 [Nesidiocoris tenuis]